jgi:hypothetical protein
MGRSCSMPAAASENAARQCHRKMCAGSRSAAVAENARRQQAFGSNGEYAQAHPVGGPIGLIKVSR